MSETPVLTIKNRSVILIISGFSLLLFVVVILGLRSKRVPGWPSLLPAAQTAVYMEFPSALPVFATQKINEMFQIDWESEVQSFAGQSAALALLTHAPTGKLVPYLFLQANNLPAAAAFAQKHGLGSTLVGSTVILALSQEDLTNILESKSVLMPSLGGEENFIRIRQNLPHPFFAYVQEALVPEAAKSRISEFFPSLPPYQIKGETFGIGLNLRGSDWMGQSYVVMENSARERTPAAYRALFLPFLPPNPDFLLAGQNLVDQIKKIDALEQVAPKKAPLLGQLMENLSVRFLPGTDFEEHIAPLLTGEFGLSVMEKSFIAIVELKDAKAAEHIREIKKAFEKTAAEISPEEKEVVLPDGTLAKEWVPNPAGAEYYEEIFQGIPISGWRFPKEQSGLFEAQTGGKWLVSNDTALLRSSLALTAAPGESFRESEGYREMLRPIMRNPEFLGVAKLRRVPREARAAKLPFGDFAFTKRMFPDHMEVQFVIR